MKKTLSAILFIALLTACHHKKSTNQSDDSTKSDETGKSTKKKITQRDFSVTPANAYNDLFFDSMALVSFIQENKVDDNIARRMTSFYNARNYQYAWFAQNGLAEQARGFWNMLDYHLNYTTDTTLKDDKLKATMDDLIGEDSIVIKPTDKKYLVTELKLTNRFISYSLNNIEDGYVKRKELEKFIPIQKMNAVALADSLIGKKHKDDKYYEDVNESYKKLKAALVTYIDIEKKGGWPQVKINVKQAKAGATIPAIAILKKRLSLTADMPAADTTAVFDTALVAGIKNFQVRYGYKQTGILTDGLVKEMNVPAAKRIEQLLMNMGRMQWMINEPNGKLMLVNIPEFILHVKDGKTKVFDMNVVVGKEGHNTTMFTGNLNQVVFSPYWNIPASIVKKEIVPGMKRNKHYLSSHNMEITGQRGGLPVVRQLPGGKNSLGKVKFLFPNSFDIYFHDTPAKSLFLQDKRAYSHGCIRLSEPAKLAEYLLKDDSLWTPARIDSAMNSGKQNYVKVKSPVPVLITYYTAWVDDDGLLHFADDIYSHDKDLAKKMFF
ncbi:MAG: L,D-transpeptidase family protein [Ferruginibacter sp.]